MKKRKVLCIMAVLLVSSLVSITFASASLTKPFAPEFTVKFVDISYDVPPTYGINQYTGANVTTSDGYHVGKSGVEFTIKNQPFNAYDDSKGNSVGVYFNFRAKGVYGDAWRYYPFAPNGVTTRRYNGLGATVYESPEQLCASNSEFTVITVDSWFLSLENIPTHGRIEFQVQTLAGYMQPTDSMLAGVVYVFSGESSDWSSIQTLTFGANDTATNPNTSPAKNDSQSDPNASPTENPTTSTIDQSGNQTNPTIDQPTAQTSFYGIVAVTIAVLAAGLGLLVYVRRRREAEQP